MGGRTTKGASQNNRQINTQTNTPPSWALPLYAQAAADAQELYRSGRGGNVYQGARVADLSQETNNAIDGLARTAAGFEDGDLVRRLQAAPQAAQNLGALATGGLRGAGSQNSAFETALQNALNESATLINSRLSGAGRYGSGAHSQVLARELGNVAAQARADGYQRDVENQLAANAQIDRANQNQLGLVNDFLNGQREAYRAALAGGQVQDGVRQAKLEGEQQKWRENDNREWERLGQLLGVTNGLVGDYGTRSGQNQTASRRNPGLGETLGSFSRLVAKR